MKEPDLGFTVIELIVSMAIISILAAVLIPNVMSFRQRSNDAAAESVARQTLMAMAATEIGSNTSSTPSCAYISPTITITTGLEQARVNAPPPVVAVSCSNDNFTNQHSVVVTYIGGSQSSITKLSEK